MKKFYLSLAAMTLFSSWLHAQNSCETALPLSGAGTFNCEAVDGLPAPVVCVGTGTATSSAGKWYAYTPIADYLVTVSTVLPGNFGDTEVSIFTGTCSSLSCLAGNDDAGGGTTLSLVSFYATAGTTYYIVFDNRWSSTGFNFQLTETVSPPPGPPPVSFTPLDVSSGTGYNYCVVDLNGDYLDDVFSLSDNNFRISYQIASGGFSDVVIPVGSVTHAPTWSVAAGDIDGNGYNDLVFGGGSGASVFYANGTGTGYTQWTVPNYIFCQRTNMVDINNDGDLDVFVCHDTAPNVYLLNQGDGTLDFHQGGMGDHPQGGNYGSVFVDYDNDGDPDLFIAKCRGGASTARINELHRNDGGGVFTNVSNAAHMADSVQTWSAAWADFDNDGYMDAMVGASSLADGSHKLMRNNGDGTFTDITDGSGFDNLTSLSLEYLTYDFDNNGYADVLCGGNTIMFNNGDMTFTPQSYAFNAGPCGDLNNDGFIDVQNGGRIYRNNGNTNNYVKLSLQGVQSNRNGIGARVELYTASGKQIRDVRSGEGFRYMHSLNVHFGIGLNTSIDSMHIIWPSGIVDYLFDTSINTRLHIIEGSHPYPAQDTATGLASVVKGKINIYPNPTTGILYIENPDGLALSSATIYNASGSEVRYFTSVQSSLDIQELPAGNYVLSIKTQSGQKITQRFLKLRR